MNRMIRNVDCPFCGASTPVAAGEPGLCKFCNGRIDPQAVGETFVPWSGRLAALARKSVVPLVFAIPVLLIGFALVAPQMKGVGFAELVCSCSTDADLSGICRRICPQPRFYAEPPLPDVIFDDPTPTPPMPPVPDVAPTQCRSPECEQWCAQFPAAELSACAHAFRAGCTVDPNTPASECGRYRYAPR